MNCPVCGSQDFTFGKVGDLWLPFEKEGVLFRPTWLSYQEEEPKGMAGDMWGYQGPMFVSPDAMDDLADLLDRDHSNLNKNDPRLK